MSTNVERQAPGGPIFARTIGVDYSGAGAPDARQDGIRVVQARAGGELEPVSGPEGRNWSRENLYQWLLQQLRDTEVVLVGIDHGFSFPIAFFEEHGLRSWDEFLIHAEKRWDTRPQRVREVVQQGEFSKYKGRAAFRITEQFSSSAKSVFDFRPNGVAHSTFAGLPWLHDLRKCLKNEVHFWPYTGWEANHGKSCVAEIYPSLFSRRCTDLRNPGGSHAHDAYAVCRWMKETDERGLLGYYFSPQITEEEKKIAGGEGWILGVL